MASASSEVQSCRIDASPFVGREQVDSEQVVV
jgi:hypothetical protein